MQFTTQRITKVCFSLYFRFFGNSIILQTDTTAISAEHTVKRNYGVAVIKYFNEYFSNVYFVTLNFKTRQITENDCLYFAYFSLKKNWGHD